jgi:mRNA interferase RelE/StbE
VIDFTLSIRDYKRMALLIPREVGKRLAMMPKAERIRILDAFEQFAADVSVRQSFVTEIVGKPGLWRLRKGDWRVLYRIRDSDIEIISLGHRRKVYE